MRVKMFITIDIDDEEYPVPADGQVGEELEESIHFLNPFNFIKWNTKGIKHLF